MDVEFSLPARTPDATVIVGYDGDCDGYYIRVNSAPLVKWNSRVTDLLRSYTPVDSEWHALQDCYTSVTIADSVDDMGYIPDASVALAFLHAVAIVPEDIEDALRQAIETKLQ